MFDDVYKVYVDGIRYYETHMKYLPIMIGTAGQDNEDQQHGDNNKRNYVSYRVNKIEFRASVGKRAYNELPNSIDYIILFKVPFREPIFDYYFGVMSNFILYSEPETVLSYGVYQSRKHYVNSPSKGNNVYKLDVNKSFVVGPNDYVGVLYFFRQTVRIDASARVWFDVV